MHNLLVISEFVVNFNLKSVSNDNLRSVMFGD